MCALGPLVPSKEGVTGSESLFLPLGWGGTCLQVAPRQARWDRGALGWWGYGPPGRSFAAPTGWPSYAGVSTSPNVIRRSPAPGFASPHLQPARLCVDPRLHLSPAQPCSRHHSLLHTDPSSGSHPACGPSFAAVAFAEPGVGCLFSEAFPCSRVLRLSSQRSTCQPLALSPGVGSARDLPGLPEAVCSEPCKADLPKQILTELFKSPSHVPSLWVDRWPTCSCIS